MSAPRDVAVRGALIFALLAVGAIALSLYLSGPGWLAPDSGVQLTQARAFAFRDDHPVLMAWMWHYTDLVVPGPRGMLILMTAGYWLGLAGLFWALPGPLWARAVGFILVGFFPPVFSNVPVVWKDELMQGALVMALGCFAIQTRRWRLARLLLGGVAFLVAIGARHNAPAAAWPLLAFPLIESRLLARWRPWLRWLTAMGAALLLTLALAIGLRRTLAPLAKATEFWQFLPAFDLAGMSLELNEVVIDRKTGLLTPGMGVEQIRRFYNPQYMNSLYYCLTFKGKPCVHVFNRTNDPRKLARLQQNWLREIGRHPIAYLKHRYRVAEPLLGLVGGARPIYYLDAAPYILFAPDYPVPERTVKLLSWIESHSGRLWFRPWFYLCINCIVIPLALVIFLRGGSSLALQCALSGFSYMCSLFVGAGSSDYRYTVWTTLSTLLAVMAAAACVYEMVRSRRRAGAPAGGEAADAAPVGAA
jgi:hypothetical protein